MSVIDFIEHSDDSDGVSLPLWPGLVDVVTAALMVFVLTGFIQGLLDTSQIEAMLLRQRQEEFLGEFRGAMSGEIESGRILVSRRFDFVQITFSDGVLFASGDHRLRSGGSRLLERCGEVLSHGSRLGIEQIQVEGHTDSLPLVRETYPRDNWELSTARALEVVRFLATRTEVSAASLSANGYADHRPVADNSTPEARAKNRRIELRMFFTPSRLDTDSASGSENEPLG